MAAKKTLARDIVTSYHGAEAATAAQEGWERRFSRKEDPTEIPDVDLPVYHGSNAWSLPIPATFVVGRDGRILARHVDPDFRHRMEPEAIVDTLARA